MKVIPPLLRKIRRRKQIPKLYDYVYAHLWADADMLDPWYVGFVDDIHTSDDMMGNTTNEYLVGGRWYNHAHKISLEEGRIMLQMYRGMI